MRPPNAKKAPRPAAARSSRCSRRTAAGRGAGRAESSRYAAVQQHRWARGAAGGGGGAAAAAAADTGDARQRGNGGQARPARSGCACRHLARREEGSKVRCHARWQVPGSICVWQIYGSTCRNETRATSTRRARLRTSGWHAPRAPVAMPAWCPCSTLLRARRRARPPRPPAGWCDCPVILVRPASVSAPTELATKSLQYRSSVSPADTSAARGRSRRNFWSLSSRLRGCLASR